MKIKTKSEEDARFFYGAFSLLSQYPVIYFGGGCNENGPVRGYWTIAVHNVDVDHKMIKEWFPDRPFIYSTTPKQTVWKSSHGVDTKQHQLNRIYEISNQKHQT